MMNRRYTKNPATNEPEDCRVNVQQFGLIVSVVGKIEKNQVLRLLRMTRVYR